VDETIRPADADDVPALAELASRTWSDAFGDSVAPEELAVELEEKRSPAYFDAVLRTDTILVAESNSALIGYVQFGDVNISELEPLPGEQELHRVYVATCKDKASDGGSPKPRSATRGSPAQAASTSRCGRRTSARSSSTRASASRPSAERRSRSAPAM
jgi:hypothetical protein